MKLFLNVFTGIAIVLILVLASSNAHALFGGKFKTIKPKDGNLYIPIKNFTEGKAKYYRAKAGDGTTVDFFIVQSEDGVIRAAIDACDVCYRSGKGYVQEGNIMVCTNCGRRFATDRINEVKGGCNPAPLAREIQGENLVISMKDINSNAWYCKYK